MVIRRDWTRQCRTGGLQKCHGSVDLILIANESQFDRPAARSNHRLTDNEVNCKLLG
jgi:hypothetical protein